MNESSEDGRRPPILKQRVRLPLQEVPFFYGDDDVTSTMTFTQGRRVSFGRKNRVKEYIPGTAASTQALQEYDESNESVSEPSMDISGPLDLANKSCFEEELDDDDDEFQNENLPPFLSPPESFTDPKPAAPPEQQVRLFTEHCISVARSVFENPETSLTAIIIGAKTPSTDEERRNTLCPSTSAYDGNTMQDSDTQLRLSPKSTTFCHKIISSSDMSSTANSEKCKFGFLDEPLNMSLATSRSRDGRQPASHWGSSSGFQHATHQDMPFDMSMTMNKIPRGDDMGGFGNISVQSVGRQVSMEETCHQPIKKKLGYAIPQAHILPKQVSMKQTCDLPSENNDGEESMEETMQIPLPQVVSDAIKLVGNAVPSDDTFNDVDEPIDDPFGRWNSVKSLQCELANLKEINQSFVAELEELPKSNSVSVSSKTANLAPTPVKMINVDPLQSYDDFEEMDLTVANPFRLNQKGIFKDLIMQSPARGSPISPNFSPLPRPLMTTPVKVFSIPPVATQEGKNVSLKSFFAENVDEVDPLIKVLDRSHVNLSVAARAALNVSPIPQHAADDLDEMDLTEADELRMTRKGTIENVISQCPNLGGQINRNFPLPNASEDDKNFSVKSFFSDVVDDVDLTGCDPLVGSDSGNREKVASAVGASSCNEQNSSRIPPVPTNLPKAVSPRNGDTRGNLIPINTGIDFSGATTSLPDLSLVARTSLLALHEDSCNGVDKDVFETTVPRLLLQDEVQAEETLHFEKVLVESVTLNNTLNDGNKYMGAVSHEVDPLEINDQENVETNPSWNTTEEVFKNVVEVARHVPQPTDVNKSFAFQMTNIARLARSDAFKDQDQVTVTSPLNISKRMSRDVVAPIDIDTSKMETEFAEGNELYKGDPVINIIVPEVGVSEKISQGEVTFRGSLLAADDDIERDVGKEAVQSGPSLETDVQGLPSTSSTHEVAATLTGPSISGMDDDANLCEVKAEVLTESMYIDVKDEMCDANSVHGVTTAEILGDENEPIIGSNSCSVFESGETIGKEPVDADTRGCIPVRESAPNVEQAVNLQETPPQEDIVETSSEPGLGVKQILLNSDHIENVELENALNIEDNGQMFTLIVSRNHHEENKIASESVLSNQVDVNFPDFGEVEAVKNNHSFMHETAQPDMEIEKEQVEAMVVETTMSSVVGQTVPMLEEERMTLDELIHNHSRKSDANQSRYGTAAINITPQNTSFEVTEKTISNIGNRNDNLSFPIRTDSSNQEDEDYNMARKDRTQSQLHASRLDYSKNFQKGLSPPPSLKDNKDSSNQEAVGVNNESNKIDNQLSKLAFEEGNDFQNKENALRDEVLSCFPEKSEGDLLNKQSPTSQGFINQLSNLSIEAEPSRKLSYPQQNEAESKTYCDFPDLGGDESFTGVFASSTRYFGAIKNDGIKENEPEQLERAKIVIEDKTTVLESRDILQLNKETTPAKDYISSCQSIADFSQKKNKTLEKEIMFNKDKTMKETTILDPEETDNAHQKITPASAQITMSFEGSEQRENVTYVKDSNKTLIGCTNLVTEQGDSEQHNKAAVLTQDSNSVDHNVAELGHRENVTYVKQITLSADEVLKGYSNMNLEGNESSEHVKEQTAAVDKFAEGCEVADSEVIEKEEYMKVTSINEDKGLKESNDANPEQDNFEDVRVETLALDESAKGYKIADPREMQKEKYVKETTEIDERTLESCNIMEAQHYVKVTTPVHIKTTKCYKTPHIEEEKEASSFNSEPKMSLYDSPKPLLLKEPGKRMHSPHSSIQHPKKNRLSNSPLHKKGSFLQFNDNSVPSLEVEQSDFFETPPPPEEACSLDHSLIINDISMSSTDHSEHVVGGSESAVKLAQMSPSLIGSNSIACQSIGVGLSTSEISHVAVSMAEAPSFPGSVIQETSSSDNITSSFANISLQENQATPIKIGGEEEHVTQYDNEKSQNIEEVSCNSYAVHSKEKDWTLSGRPNDSKLPESINKISSGIPPMEELALTEHPELPKNEIECENMGETKLLSRVKDSHNLAVDREGKRIHSDSPLPAKPKSKKIRCSDDAGKQSLSHRFTTNFVPRNEGLVYKVRQDLLEWSKEPSCPWQFEQFRDSTHNTPGLFQTSFPLLDVRLTLSVEFLTENGICLVTNVALTETNSPVRGRHPKYQLVANLGLEAWKLHVAEDEKKIKTDFSELPIFFDLCASFSKRLEPVLQQAATVLRGYAGSRLHDFGLRFRLCSLPTFMSTYIEVDLFEMLSLGRCSKLRFISDMGVLNERAILDVLRDSWTGDTPLLSFVKGCVAYIVGEEKKLGRLTKRPPLLF